MKISWVFGGIIMLIVGLIITITVIGAIFGVPLIILSVFLMLMGICMTDKPKEKPVRRI